MNNSTTKTLEQLQQMAEEVMAKRDAVPFERLDRELSIYNNFVDDIRYRLSEVRSIEDFLVDFRMEWQASLSVLNLPGRLCLLHDYLASAEQLNAEVLRTVQVQTDASQCREITKLMHPVDRSCMDILDASESFYRRPFNKDRLRNLLVGAATKRAIYTHLLAVCDYKDIAAMVDRKEIKEETILSLPRAVTVHSCSLSPDTDKNEALHRYYNNLQSLYRNFNLELPQPVMYKDEPLKGVTFEGRDKKMQYLHTKVQDDFSRIVLSAEKYQYTPAGGVPEPAIRVLAHIPGVCKPVDIGNLDRELAKKIGADSASIALEIEDMGFFTADGQSKPYMCMNVTVVGDAVPLEKEHDGMKLSEEFSDMFSMEELK